MFIPRDILVKATIPGGGSVGNNKSRENAR
jgi:hypothetical protein